MSMQRNDIGKKEQRFVVSLPPATHRVPATCADVDCPHYIGGWMTIVGKGSPQEDYITRLSGRRYKVGREYDQTIEYIFEAGQRCFREHTDLSGRPPYYIHQTQEGRRVHSRGKDFIEHVHEEIDKNTVVRKRG